MVTKITAFEKNRFMKLLVQLTKILIFQIQFKKLMIIKQKLPNERQDTSLISKIYITFKALRPKETKNKTRKNKIRNRRKKQVENKLRF